MGYCLGEKKGPEGWVDFQGSLFPNSRMVSYVRNPAKVVGRPAQKLFKTWKQGQGNSGINTKTLFKFGGIALGKPTSTCS